MTTWRQHFPYREIREIQERSLDILFSQWDQYDVFVLSAPTAYGKSSVAKTIMNYHRSTSVITPTNILVDQFLAEFPGTCRLSRLDSYHCETWDRSCAKTKSKMPTFCKGCPAAKDLRTAKYMKGPGIYNYYIYLVHKLYRDVLVVDEAHNLIPTIRDRMALKLWQHDYQYPSNMYTTEDMLRFIREMPERGRHGRQSKKAQLWLASLTSRKPEYIVQRTTELFNGKGTVRGEPEERDVLKLLPVDISDAPPMFWPKEVSKVILLSATISKKDIETLGLSRRRILYINCESPIPAERRPVVIDPIVSINRFNIERSAEAVAKYIDEILAPRFAGKKGVVHATYQMSKLLSRHLTGSRYLFHTRENKRGIYEAFRKAPPESGTVLVACGMYEGIDLPEDLGRWQVISKIPWMSLASPAVKYLAEEDPELYYWETLRTVIQACGRICRGPTDLGHTYILDGTFERLYSNTADLRPAWFSDALLNPGEEI